MTPSTSTKLRGAAAYLAIICLLLQAMSAAWHAPATSRIAVAAGIAATDGLLGSFVICSPHGTRTMTLDADGSPIETPAPSDPRRDCSLCLALSAFSLDAPLSTCPAAWPHARSIRIDWAYSIQTHRGKPDGIDRNRGPPSRSA